MHACSAFIGFENSTENCLQFSREINHCYHGNDDPGLILACFTAMSNLVYYAKYLDGDRC